MLAGDVGSVPEAEYLLRSNRAVAALVLPANLGARLSRGESAQVQLLVDGTDGTIANFLLVNTESLVSAVGAALDRRPPSFLVAVATRYNPGGESAMFLLPGTIAYVLALVSVLLTALAVAREWERGSMEQLFATSVGIPGDRRRQAPAVPRARRARRAAVPRARRRGVRAADAGLAAAGSGSGPACSSSGCSARGC